ncbi:pyridoxal 5'-phosphate synthase glutaminase subunit PdxT [Georgenia faecalis]|uniref:Pyridoxal 5'-phosphate synthase subunit PdxT n=1 Tax=Georgenia faecalis TaxID=2483799 RepID=A0ABV9DCU6_9MICO|nr:pyridoxal 5'-phosphate synthase glutaminase subunit PdxT [Georgenia faecalis]
MTSRPTIGVLALQGDVGEHLAALEAGGARGVTVRRRSELGAVDGLVLPGGESTTMDKLLRAFDLAAPLRALIRQGLPVYGSCAGMILLADRVLDATDERTVDATDERTVDATDQRTLDATGQRTLEATDQRTVGGIDMTVRRNAFGRQVDSFEEDLAAPGLAAGDAPLRAVYIRAPWVEEAGPDVAVLARVGSGPAAGRIVAVRQDVLLATAFHPEIGGDVRVHAHFIDIVRGAA